MPSTHARTVLPTHHGLPGEHVMPHAPTVRLPNGMACIPQHYWSYRHDLASLSEIAARISFDAHTLNRPGF